MKIIIAVASALSFSILNTSATSQDDAFQKIAHDYIEHHLRANQSRRQSSVVIVSMVS